MNSVDYGVSMSIVQDPLEFRNFMNTHWLMLKSRFVTAHKISCILFISSTDIGLIQITDSIDYIAPM